MRDKTELKILDAALKEFAKEGYVGARTRVIAENAGFSEMTLFRKFKTKENLFNMVLSQNQKIILKEIDQIFSENRSQNSLDSFKVLIMHIMKLIDDNFEYVGIFLNERRRTSEVTIEGFNSRLSQYIDDLFPNNTLDTKVFAFNILSFLYFIVFYKKQGHSYIDQKKAVEEFINYSINSLQP